MTMSVPNLAISFKWQIGSTVAKRAIKLMSEATKLSCLAKKVLAVLAS